MNRPLRVAIVGAGPAGMYAAGHLLEGAGGTFLDGRLQHLVNRPVEVDVFERLPVPWGLVRHGVAPDHPDKKRVQQVYEDIAARPGFRFFGNVELGEHVSVAELGEWYDAVIHAVGASGDAALGIPGENLPGSLSAREFVAWYNGHPDYRELTVDLSVERAVIVGNGNVAMDVARILSLSPDVLAKTDIADHALEALRRSRIREVVVLGRRAPYQGAFNNPELEELGELPGVDIGVDTGDAGLESDVFHEVMDDSSRRKVATLKQFSGRPIQGYDRRILLKFMASPLEIAGQNRVEHLRIARNRLERDDNGQWLARATDQVETLDCGLVLRANGFKGVAIPGLPFDAVRGVVPSQDGRVLVDGEAMPGHYVTGWIKRGPRGIIGTNKKCARDTVRALLADADAGRLSVAGTLDAVEVERRIRERQPDTVNLAGWRRLEAAEIQAGRLQGRPRVKRTRVADMLTASAHR
jgi:ferredoxin--NADP+ reductase